jgi:hypothetical protein
LPYAVGKMTAKNEKKSILGHFGQNLQAGGRWRGANLLVTHVSSRSGGWMDGVPTSENATGDTIWNLLLAPARRS